MIYKRSVFVVFYFFYRLQDVVVIIHQYEVITDIWMGTHNLVLAHYVCTFPRSLSMWYVYNISTPTRTIPDNIYIIMLNISKTPQRVSEFHRVIRSITKRVYYIHRANIINTFPITKKITNTISDPFYVRIRYV